MVTKQNGGHQASTEKKEKKAKSWWWALLIFGGTWFLTGFPGSFLRPHWVEVRAVATEASYGVSVLSWQQDLTLDVASSLISWGAGFGIHEATLRGSFRAASLERNLQTGVAQEGTGNKVDVFTILAITANESSLGGEAVNPEEANPTGYCRAWSELMRHKLLNGPKEVLALRKIVEPLGYSVWSVYGSCGAGAIGWTQALPSVWWELMGAGFNPWSREDSPELTARYLTTRGYFTQGRRYAVHAYNPYAADAVYTLPVVRLAEKMEASFAETSLTVPEVTVAQQVTERGGTKEELGSQNAKLALDALIGIPYKDFGYRDNNGSWCTWTGGEPLLDSFKGLNCGGFLLEAARAIYGPIGLQVVGSKRDDREDPTENGDWLWFGHDEVMNLSDFLGGETVVDGPDWEVESGFLVKDWENISFQECYLYLGSLNIKDAVAGRKHHHVVAMLSYDGGVSVYEATNYYGDGVQSISLQDLQGKYEVLDADYRMLVVRIPLRADGQTIWPATASALETVEVQLAQMPVDALRSGDPFGTPTSEQLEGHTGVDFGVGTGTPVHSVGDGVVVWADWWQEGAYWKIANKGHGNTVWVFHGYTSEGQPVYSVYAHFSKYLVEVGDRVQTGDVVGLSGNTGASSGPHLHFAVRVGGGWRRDGVDDQGRDWKDGQWVDPDEWVGKDAPTFFTEIPSGREQQQGPLIPAGQEVTLTLRETPVLKSALWVGGLLNVVRTGRELDVVLEKIPKVGKLVEFIRKLEDPLDRLHAVLSVWSIAGQPRELRLDPLLNWRILSAVE